MQQLDLYTINYILTFYPLNERLCLCKKICNKFLLEQVEIEINKMIPQQQLIFGAQYGFIDIVGRMITNKICNLQIGLKCALFSNQYHVIEYMLKHGVNPVIDTVRTSCIECNPKIIKLLVKYSDEFNELILQHASRQHKHDVIKIVVSAGMEKAVSNALSAKKI